MSLQTRLEALVAAIGADIKSLQNQVNSIPGATSARESILEKTQGWYFPNPTSTSISQIGATTPVATGTVTAASRTITNKHTRARRVDYLVTAASNAAVAGWRGPGNHLVRGSSATAGGFYAKTVWGPATGVATATSRAFVGLSSSTASPTDVEPSTQTLCIGMGWDAGDANVQIMHNDGTGTCTKVNLGASFPIPTTDRTNLYEIEIWCAAGETKLNWQVTDLATGAIATGNTGVSTDIPPATQYLSERGWMSVGGTSAVIGIALGGFYYETPNA